MSPDIGGSLSEEKLLGQVVQQARQAAGLTQQALCQKSGLSYSTLAKIERGAIKAPSVFTIRHIAVTLGMSLDQLLEGVVGGVQAPRASLQQQNAKKVSRNGVRFVYFDMNGCLVRAAVTKAAAQLAADSNVTADVIESIFWQYNSSICRGDVSIDELNTVLAQRLNMLVDWNKYYLASVEATPGIDELVAWVAENYHVGIVTNTLPGLVAPMLDQGIIPNVPYDAIVDSSEVRSLKPEPHMFEIAAGLAGVSVRELLLVDDDPLNLAAAGQMGWNTMSFDAYQPEASIASIRAALQPAE